ncbi:MAG: dihydrolipoyl dehydrogenase [Chlamydiia bacterium]|nr:dihydrolipoyl dehydrogenase [Chlamydiia bacterium]
MVDKKKFDIAVVGSGPGGYTAAIRAAQCGKSVALIEKNLLGGTCLNVGCIPSKALLAGSALLHQIRKASEFGISTGSVSVDYGAMKQRKDLVVGKIRSGLEGLIASNRISLFRGEARFEAPQELKVVGHDNLYIRADNIIIATGSIPFDVPAFPCDHKRILNSTSLLEITKIPKSLCIVGGGYIGCEFASLFAELGSKVTILEALPSILSPQGAQISAFMTKSFSAKGIMIRTNAKVEKIMNKGQSVQILLADGSALESELCLIAVGRKTYSDGLMLEKAGLSLTNKGVLETNAKMETVVKGIYAIGDITGKWMLAHVASHQGIVAASNAAGHEETIHYEAVPAVIFTSPEIAMVGMTSEQALSAGKTVAAGLFPFQALGKAQAAADTEGFTQILSDKATGQILGACVIGHGASDLIAEMALAIQNELTLDCIIGTIHAHPTIAEGWLEAALLAAERPIHFPPKAKR